MASTPKRILVTLRSLTTGAAKELKKAAALARAAGARIELFHVIEEPDPGASWPESLTLAEMRRLRDVIAAKHLRRLERLAKGATLRGLRVTCTASWDHPAHEAIVRQAVASRADLVIAGTHGHTLRTRLLLRNTDWELIRHCPVPVLLVKSPRPWRSPAVLAAVDPFHAHVRPADLDTGLLGAGATLAKLVRGSLHVFHAYLPLTSVTPVPVSAAPLMILPPEAEEAHAAQVARDVGRLATRAGVPARRTHLAVGDVATELAALARRIGAAVVVMGAVSRSALARMFIGNTAERALEHLGCDVLVVKPRGFRSSVPRALARRAQ